MMSSYLMSLDAVYFCIARRAFHRLACLFSFEMAQV